MRSEASRHLTWHYVLTVAYKGRKSRSPFRIGNSRLRLVRSAIPAAAMMHSFLPWLLLSVTVSAVTNMAAEQAVTRQSSALRLHRRENELPRYTPFYRLSNRHMEVIDIFEYWSSLGSECFCKVAKVVSAYGLFHAMSFFSL